MTEPSGTRRTEPFLVLDENGIALRDAIIKNTNRVRSRATSSPTRQSFALFDPPEVGDLVLELTRASWSKNERIRTIGFGYLVGRVGETTYIQYGPDPTDVSSWENAMFVRVPDKALVVDLRRLS